ncbi:MAG: hypothetical protein NTV87_13325 [Ignavibacteriae bacterium]|nr:hypothetical protein [Ignavibacteriota bacterium]
MITYDLINIVAKGLKELINDVVFVGGAFVNLYSTDASATDIRPTDDIDCVVEVTHRSGYNVFEEHLRKLGFRNDLEKNAPICRYVFNGIKVDFIPTTENILGFQNKWYPAGFKNAIYHKFPDGLEIKIFSSVYYLASKLDAFWDRGRSDIRLSTDFEDIIFILDSRKEIVSEIKDAEASVKNYIKEKFKYLINHANISEGIICVLPVDSNISRVNFIKDLITEIVSI